MNDKTFFCQKLQRQATPMHNAPYPGELGEKVLAHISHEAWLNWLKHQTTLINEYRLNPLEPQTVTFIEQQMEDYFFGQGSPMPAGFQAVEDEDIDHPDSAES